MSNDDEVVVPPAVPEEARLAWCLSEARTRANALHVTVTRATFPDTESTPTNLGDVRVLVIAARDWAIAIAKCAGTVDRSDLAPSVGLLDLFEGVVTAELAVRLRRDSAFTIRLARPNSTDPQTAALHSQGPTSISVLRRTDGPAFLSAAGILGSPPLEFTQPVAGAFAGRLDPDDVHLPIVDRQEPGPAGELPGFFRRPTGSGQIDTELPLPRGHVRADLPNWPRIRALLVVGRQVVTARMLMLSAWAAERVRALETALVPVLTEHEEGAYGAVRWIVESAASRREVALQGIAAELLVNLVKNRRVTARRKDRHLLVASIPELDMWIETVPGDGSASADNAATYSLDSVVVERAELRDRRGRNAGGNAPGRS